MIYKMIVHYIDHYTAYTELPGDSYDFSTALYLCSFLTLQVPYQMIELKIVWSEKSRSDIRVCAFT